MTTFLTISQNTEKHLIINLKNTQLKQKSVSILHDSINMTDCLEIFSKNKQKHLTFLCVNNSNSEEGSESVQIIHKILIVQKNKVFFIELPVGLHYNRLMKK